MSENPDYSDNPNYPGLGRWVDSEDYIEADDIAVGVSRRYADGDPVPDAPTHVVIQLDVKPFHPSLPPIRVVAQLNVEAAEGFRAGLTDCLEAVRDGRVPQVETRAPEAVSGE